MGQNLILSQAARLMGHDYFGDEIAAGYCVDSRLIKKGDLFFALPGAKADGHHFLQEAAAKHAVAAVVGANYNGESYGLPLIKVKDPLEALQTLAKRVLEHRQVRTVGITGSLGKTTTKDFIATILKEKFRVAASPGNSNSQTGLPLNILNHTKGDEEILVLEMGMTHPGNIAKLVHIAPPEIALITTIDLVHIANFDSLEGIARAKSEILSHPKTKLGIISYDIENYAAIFNTGACSKLSFSVSSSCADYFLEAISDRLHVTEKGGEKIALGTLNTPGKHNQHNFLAAVAVARSLGISWDEIRHAMGACTLPERRLQHIEKLGVLFVNDSYNASMSSVKAALDTLPAPKKGGKRIAVIGSMLELGKYSAECHQKVGEHALQKVDKMLCLGQECSPICDCWSGAGRQVELFMTRADLVEALRKSMQEGDVVLLKGSKAKELWKVIEEI